MKVMDTNSEKKGKNILFFTYILQLIVSKLKKLSFWKQINLTFPFDF